MSEQPKTTWPILNCVDALAQIEFLKTAFGFTEAIAEGNIFSFGTYRGEA